MRDDRDAITCVLDFRENVARHEHGAPFGGEPLQQRAHLEDAGRVEPVRRLVEDEELRILHQCRRDPEPLFHAERVGRVSRVAASTETDLGEHRVHSLGSDAARAAEQLEVAPAREAREERRLFDEGADPVDRAGEVARHVAAEDRDAAAGAAQQADRSPDRRGLSRPVGAEEAEDPALGNRQVEAGERGHDAAPGAVAHPHVVEFDRRHRPPLA